MKDYIVADKWKIIENHFDPHLQMNSESLFSIGNGRMGQRANFEETYSGPSLRGSYIAGVYYPDKTRVGWWKNGYPEYFAKVLNSVNWIGIELKINGEIVDLYTCKVIDFKRELDMKSGLLKRSVTIKLKKDRVVEIRCERFYSMAQKDLCLMQYRVQPVNFNAKVNISWYLDTNVLNSDANYQEDFWKNRKQGIKKKKAWVMATTRKTGFTVCAAMRQELHTDNASEMVVSERMREGRIERAASTTVTQGGFISLKKYVSIASTFYHREEELVGVTTASAKTAMKDGFKKIRKAQARTWGDIWKRCDVEILGDVKAQQGIRFNIFQMIQTYTGDDPRLNIGPKGFTGEKYGGSTYWDTEAYCLPFYMSTTDPSVGRNLLIYRYNHLEKAIENASKLGFSGGAALYPMVTMNGEECHNEWEITFEEIHRNGAIAYAIHDYIRYTGDKEYLVDYGLEVLIAIARFWAQRVHVSPRKRKYVMHGVTGPNEYENNVNNNWYTNYIAAWCLQYAIAAARWVEERDPQKYTSLRSKINLDEESEFSHWNEIVEEMYYPVDESRGIFLQNDGFEDKEDLTVKDLDHAARPLNQNWSWDRILRSPFIKQADVLQGLYFFEEDFGIETIRRNFEYYEPKTVHESSLSPCVHSILAALIGNGEKAYEMYLRTARLDLDDYNNDTEDGCHITSMAGTWLSIVKGFAGMRVRDGVLHFKPFIPPAWEAYAFRISFRGQILRLVVGQEEVKVENLNDGPFSVVVFDECQNIEGNADATVRVSQQVA